MSSITDGRCAVSRCHRGFTLIELLVVIAIIAILASMLLPVFARAREKARQSACLSNTKQLLLALNMYAQDYDETYPPGYTAFQDSPNWRDFVVPYIRNTQVLVCPSQRKDRPVSYGLGYAVQGRSTNSWDDDTRVVAIGETVGYEAKYWSVLPLSSDPATCSNVYIDPRHNNGLNIGFADGHAKWLAKDATENGDIIWQ
ncbi:MAG TPA: hypothetical protein DGT21_09390 [Armatimonadetes bacterium]|nr:hypothetical protein [Armatimonadota bacterium]